MTEAYTRQQYTWREVTLELSAAEELRQIEVAGDYIRVDEASDPSAHVFVRVGDPYGPRRKMRLSAEIDGAEFGALYLDWPAQPRDGGTFAWVKLLIATTHGQVRFGSPDPLEIDLTGIVAVEQGLITSDGTRRRDSRTWLDLYLEPAPGFSPIDLTYAAFIESVATLAGGTPSYPGHRYGARWDGRLWALKGTSTWTELDAEFNHIRDRNDAPNSGGFTAVAFDFDGEDKNSIFYIDGDGDRLMHAGRYSGSAGTVVDSSLFFDSVDDDVVAVEGRLYWWRSNAADDDTRGLYWANLEQLRTGSHSWTQNVSVTALEAAGMGNFTQARIGFDGRYIHIKAGGNSSWGKVDPVDDTIPAAGAGDDTRGVVAWGNGRLYAMSNSDGSTADKDIREVWPGHGDDLTITLEGRALPGYCRGPRLTRPKQPARTTATVNAIDNGDGTYSINGELIRLALAWYAGDWNAVPSDYLDHVYGVRIGEAGPEQTVIVSRAQTFAAAGIADAFAARLPQPVSIQVDRELLAGALF